MSHTASDGGESRDMSDDAQISAVETDAAAPVATDAESLARENAYLREAVARYKDVAAAQATLIARIAELESELKTAQEGAAGHTQLAVAWDDEEIIIDDDDEDDDGEVEFASAVLVPFSAAPAPAPVAAPPVDPKQSFADGFEPAAATPRMLIVCAPLIDPIQWDLFGRQQLNDVVFGLPEGVGIDILSGPLSAAALRDFAPVARKYGARFHTAPAALADTPATWAGAVATAVERLEAETVIFLDPSSYQAAAVERVGALPIRKIAIFSGGEMRDLFGQPAAFGPAAAQLAGALARFDLLLTTSAFEAERFRASLPASVDMDVNLRGVDVTHILPRTRSDSGKVVVGIGADRLGPTGLRQIMGAAAALSDADGVEFRVYSASALPESANLRSRKVARRSEYAEIYQESDVVIVPADCSGFSQTLMEALASGCVCLVPERAFAEYVDDDLLPYETYPAQEGALAGRIRSLIAQPDHVARIRRDAPLFARRYLRRSYWRERLRNSIGQAAEKDA